MQLKFGKRTALLHCLIKELPRFLQDFPIEILSTRADIIEQLIIFGNSNDCELKQALIPSYRLLISKMEARIDMLGEKNYRNSHQSITALKAISLTSDAYIKSCYPSLDPNLYTAEHYRLILRQRPGKYYSFITMVDAFLKNIINLCTDNQLIGDFSELWLHYCLPLLGKLKPLNPKIIKKMTISFLMILGRLLNNSPLDDLTGQEVMLITPIFEVGLRLFLIFGVDEWTKAELFTIRDFINQLHKGVYLYVFDEEQIKVIVKIMEIAENRATGLYKHVRSIVTSIDALRTFEAFCTGFEVKGRNDFSRREEWLEDYYRKHRMMKEALEAIEYTNYLEIIGKRPKIKFSQLFRKILKFSSSSQI